MDELLDAKQLPAKKLIPVPATKLEKLDNSDLTTIVNYIQMRNFLVQTLNDLTVSISKEQRKLINAKIIELAELILTLTLSQNFSDKLLKLKQNEAQELSK